MPDIFTRSRQPWRLTLCAIAILVSACAARVVPPLPSVLRHPDFVYPSVPAALAQARGVDGIDRGWRYLQNDQLDAAQREFENTLRRTPSMYPAHAGRGYVALARRDYERALRLFDTALRPASTYAPALAGRGQALLGTGRIDQALDAFEAALAADPTLTGLRQRIEAVRFRGVQALIESGRAAAAAGRLADARTTFQRALTSFPDSGLLYRELGLVERRLGDAPAALAHFRRAAELDPGDAAALIQAGELLEAQMDFAGAEAAYRAANDIEPSADLESRMNAAAARARDARLPPQFRAIATASQITRGDLAALIGVRLENTVREMPGREDVLTDIRGHWASSWITQVARAGIVEAFENHTFQPVTRLRRVDLAAAASRVVTYFAASRPELRARLAVEPVIADVPRRHLNYPQVAAAVASGVLPLLEGDRFDLSRPVSGAEAVEVVDRLRVLASSAR